MNIANKSLPEDKELENWIDDLLENEEIKKDRYYMGYKYRLFVKLQERVEEKTEIRNKIIAILQFIIQEIKNIDSTIDKLEIIARNIEVNYEIDAYEDSPLYFSVVLKKMKG